MDTDIEMMQSCIEAFEIETTQDLDSSKEMTTETDMTLPIMNFDDAYGQLQMMEQTFLEGRQETRRVLAEAYTCLLQWLDNADLSGADPKDVKEIRTMMQSHKTQFEQEPVKQKTVYPFNPSQPFGYDGQDVLRYKQNAIVSDLLLAINKKEIEQKLQSGQYSIHDYRQLLQVAGYEMMQTSLKTEQDHVEPKAIVSEPHPIQYIGYSNDGVLRFKPNVIVAHIAASFDLNGIALQVGTGAYSSEDYAQLLQLTGYPVLEFLHVPCIQECQTLLQEVDQKLKFIAGI